MRTSLPRRRMFRPRMPRSTMTRSSKPLRSRPLRLLPRPPVRRRPAPAAIAWQATEPLPRGWRTWLGRLLAGYLAALGHPGAGVTLLVGSDADLKRLNARHRRRARPTDILSFSYLDPDLTLPGPPSPEGEGGSNGTLLGELAVSFDRVKAQALENGWSARTELARLLAHGCAHLVGHDHATAAQDRAMLRVEIGLLEGAGFPGLYGFSERTGAARRRAKKQRKR